MTEAEWLTSADLPRLIKTQRRSGKDRKLRLFACGCARQIWEFLTEQSARLAVELAESFADGKTTAAEVEKANQAVSRAWMMSGMGTAGLIWTGKAVLLPDASQAALYASAHAPNVGVPSGTFSRKAEMAALHHRNLALFRDIVGNPFRPVEFETRWRSEAAVALATGIYADRAFDRMPVLADALEEAGCDHADILSHCRDPHQPHARGCWVVDLVLNKA